MIEPIKVGVEYMGILCNGRDCCLLGCQRPAVVKIIWEMFGGHQRCLNHTERVSGDNERGKIIALQPIWERFTPEMEMRWDEMLLAGWITE